MLKNALRTGDPMSDDTSKRVALAALLATSMGCGDVVDADNFDALFGDCSGGRETTPNGYLDLDPATVDCDAAHVWVDIRLRVYAATGVGVNVNRRVCPAGAADCVAHADPSVFDDAAGDGVTTDNWGIVIAPDLDPERYEAVAMREFVAHMSRQRSAAPEDGCLDAEAIAAICRPERGWKCDYEVPEDCGEEDK